MPERPREAREMREPKRLLGSRFGYSSVRGGGRFLYSVGVKPKACLKSLAKCHLSGKPTVFLISLMLREVVSISSLARCSLSILRYFAGDMPTSTLNRCRRREGESVTARANSSSGN